MADAQDISTLDDANKAWMNALLKIWNSWKKSPGVTQILCEYFESAPNPYYSALKISVNAHDFYQNKTKSSLSFTVIEEFAKWINPIKENYKQCLSVDLKVSAYTVMSKQKNMQLTKLVSDVYEFIEDKPHFISFVQEHIENKNYKEAGQLVEMLSLQNHFSDPKILVLPLFLQNKNTIAESILEGHKELQLSFISFLDDMMAPDKNSQDILDKYIMEYDVQDVRMPTFHTKVISKLVARLIKLYKIPPETCPNLCRKRVQGALQFIIHKYYVDQTLSTDSFREMAKEAIGNEKQLQIDILHSLCNYNDMAEAHTFAKFYNIPAIDWPWYLEQYVQNPQNGDSNESSEDYNYELPLPRDNIIIIDTSQSFAKFLENVSTVVEIVGIDCEWKPILDGMKKPKLALMQIATRTKVYILDVFTLKSSVPKLDEALANQLFNNKNIKKLGFGFHYDLQTMREVLPALPRSPNSSYVDLYEIWRKLKDDANFEEYVKEKNKDNALYDKVNSMPDNDGKNHKETLSSVVKKCFGRKLNKNEQFSNWEGRPLREPQIMYAALDSFILLEIYDQLQEFCNIQGFSIKDFCDLYKSNKIRGKEYFFQN